jgi:hypothetical protein
MPMLALRTDAKSERMMAVTRRTEEHEESAA